MQILFYGHSPPPKQVKFKLFPGSVSGGVKLISVKQPIEALQHRLRKNWRNKIVFMFHLRRLGCSITTQEHRTLLMIRWAHGHDSLHTWNDKIKYLECEKIYWTFSDDNRALSRYNEAIRNINMSENFAGLCLFGSDRSSRSHNVRSSVRSSVRFKFV